MPEPFGVDDPDLALGGRAELWDVLLRVHVHARHEDAVDALELVERGPALGAFPDGFPGDEILALGENQGDVEIHACGGQ